MLENKICGVIYGQFIGDALGTRYEFKSSEKVKGLIEQDKINNFLPILGEGPFAVKKGQVTDDTELAMGLMYSILEQKTYDKEAVAKKYIKWATSKPFDFGKTTFNALNNATSYQEIVNNSNKHNKTSISNGCLMRISPLAIYGIKLSDQELMDFCFQDTIMTNPNPISIDMVKVYCMAIKTALTTNDKKIIIQKAYNVASTKLVKQIISDSIKRPEPVLTLSGEYVAAYSEFMGYAGIALQNAFYELFNGKSFYSSLVNVISRGGDTDTNGCIVGALLGAYYGVSNVPDSWIQDVNINNPRVNNYKEIDQTKIGLLCKRMCDLIKS